MPAGQIFFKYTILKIILNGIANLVNYVAKFITLISCVNKLSFPYYLASYPSPFPESLLTNFKAVDRSWAIYGSQGSCFEVAKCKLMHCKHKLKARSLIGLKPCYIQDIENQDSVGCLK